MSSPFDDAGNVPVPRHDRVPPLGVHVNGDGIDVAVLAPHASAVDLCLIDVVSPELPPHDFARYRERRVPLTGPVYGVWHAHVPHVGEGQRYGFRVHGRWDPEAGLRHNPAKLLVDPYARGITGDTDYTGAIFGQQTHPAGDAVVPVGDPYGPPDTRDSLAHVPHSVVVGRRDDLPVKRPYTPWRDTVIYEAHVRGLTKKLHRIPEHLRGTYAGLAHPVTIEHLQRLGVTAVELLPIHAYAHETHLIDKGLTNYWGYSTLGFFAPHPAYATRGAQEAGAGAVLDEVRGMVHLLHEAGIEVILDVVYNHTCEGGIGGPHLSWRGLDNAGYYWHDGSYPAQYSDFTGCGNTLDFRRPRVVQMALDSLRYWANDVGVDGFRFDLAVALARDSDGFRPHHPFLVAMAAEPCLNQLKLIAEPWDVGPGGWRTGAFPTPMAEWNDRFRDGVRQFWLSDAREASHGRPGAGIRDLATRLAGSADVFGPSDPPLARGPVASINYVTAHDGFTLADLMSNDHKHNEANCEDNRDGSNDNRSWNHGIEGRLQAASMGRDQALDPGSEIAPLRRRSMRNLLGTLILSAGTPMITAGDEFGRTQRGNNNAYAQDNDVSWVAWNLTPWREDLVETTRYLLRMRRENAVLRPDSFYTGRPRAGAGNASSPGVGQGPGAAGNHAGTPDELPRDLTWFGADGVILGHDAWNDPLTRVFQMLRTGPNPGDRGVLIIANGQLEDVDVVVAGVPGADSWELAWDSVWLNPNDRLDLHDRGPEGSVTLVRAGNVVGLETLSMQVYLSR